MTIQTARLTLRRPLLTDAQAIFDNYASDPKVTRYLSWPTHTRVEDTHEFIAFSDAQWQQWQAGPLIIEQTNSSEIIGSAGLDFEAPDRAATGYCFAQSSWGNGYATEATLAMITLAKNLGVKRLEALCHHEHRASAHVLKKAGFTLDATLQRHTVFINNHPTEPADVLLFACLPDSH